MSEDKKCSKCGKEIPEGKDNCEQMQFSVTEINPVTKEFLSEE